MIPVFINVRNRLTTTRILADQVAALDDALPVLIDNASNWPPLLDWYARCPYEVIRLTENVGHHAPWLRVIPGATELKRRFDAEFYAVTDCDLDISDCPADTLARLQEPFNWKATTHKPIVKAGLSLRIDDLPEWQTSVLKWESRWWRHPVNGGKFYSALVDTTFCLFRSSTPHQKCMTVVNIPSVRSAPPYCARHMPWYLDGDNLDDENRHYFATASESNSWKPAGKALASRYAK